MATFLGRLRVIRLEDRYGWALLQPLIYRSDLDGVGELVVPSGFVTDFESAPRWLPLAFTLAYDRATAAAVLHDWLYRTRPVVGLPPHTIPRREADALFREAMAASRVARWRRGLLWAAVRVGGWAAWRR